MAATAIAPTQDRVFTTPKVNETVIAASHERMSAHDAEMEIMEEIRYADGIDVSDSRYL